MWQGSRYLFSTTVTLAIFDHIQPEVMIKWLNDDVSWPLSLIHWGPLKATQFDSRSTVLCKSDATSCHQTWCLWWQNPVMVLFLELTATAVLVAAKDSKRGVLTGKVTVLWSLWSVCEICCLQEFAFSLSNKSTLSAFLLFLFDSLQIWILPPQLTHPNSPDLLNGCIFGNIFFGPTF